MMERMEHIIRQYTLEPGALEAQYIEEYFTEFKSKKTADEINRWTDEVEASSLYNHAEKRDFFSEEVRKLGLDPAETTTFEWLEVDDRVSHERQAA